MKKIAGKIRKVTSQQVIARLIYYSLIIQRIFYNGLVRLREFIAGLSLSVLSHEGVAHLNKLIYEAKKGHSNKGLFKWEKEWFENDLPTPPARLLIGGAGSGREVKSLIKKGYQIVAFDPVGWCVENAKREILEKNCIDYLTGAYEELLFKNSANSAMNHTVHTHGPYDAVILGWGSFTHICDVDKRLALLLKIKELCPQGPVLLSFWLKDDSEGAGRRKIFKIGYRIGNFFKNHGKQLSELPPEGDDINPYAGYGHFFIMPEIEKMIEACNYQLVENPKVSYLKYYPHITIRPSTKK